MQLRYFVTRTTGESGEEPLDYGDLMADTGLNPPANRALAGCEGAPGGHDSFAPWSRSVPFLGQPVDR